MEHLQAGADLVMGSLIKSPGGTIATGGGYIAGRRDLVAASNVRLTAPGIGLDSGCVSGESLRLMFQGKAWLWRTEHLASWRKVALCLLSQESGVVRRPDAGADA